jgi:GntR family transcriptional regulator of arabinose operon
MAVERPASTRIPKHRQVYEELLAAIESGKYGPGDRLPSEVDLGKHFDTSRITIAKAVNELQKQGLISRRAGSGSHVLPRSVAEGHVFGLLIPDLGRTEIFEPICQGMMRLPDAAAHSLLWSNSMGTAAEQEREAEQLCHRYIAQKVSGVFFSPLEFTDHKDMVNRRIVSALQKAGIPLILLDRHVAPYPERSAFDLVGIDNQRAGFMITAHLLQLNCRRICFLARSGSAPTVDARASGWREAQHAFGVIPQYDLEWRGDPEDRDFIEKILTTARPEAFVCANDITAAHLMQTLHSIGIVIPEQVRIVGVDDVKYAGLLPIPLTTQHQDCGDIGAAAMLAMLSRIAHPKLPARDILLHTRTIVRQSCGSHLGPIKH